MTYHLLPELTYVSRVSGTVGTQAEDLLTQLIEEERKSMLTNVQRSLRGRERLAAAIEEEKLVSEEHMSYRLRNVIPKWGDTLPDLDSEEIIAAWRRKRGI